MSLNQFYECHQCHSVFLRGQTMNGKFCGKPCYITMRKEKGVKYVKALQPILIREEIKQKNGRPPVETVPVQQNDEEVIPFDSLTIDEVKLIISNQADQLSAREIEIQNLNAIVTKYEQTIIPLKKLALTFVNGYDQLENEFSKPVDFIDPYKICAGKDCHNKVSDGRIFCSDACAKSVLPKLGKMIMNDGRVITK
jgi:hypothetical protein